MITARNFPSLAILALAIVPIFALSARADKIHFLSKTDSSKIVGNAPNFIEGVVVSKTEDKIEIRVQGGTMIVDAKQVAWIETDGLKTADIEGREKAAADRLQVANSERRQAQGAWANAVAKNREAQRQAEPKELRIVVDFKGILPARVLRFYNPILHRVDTQGIADVVEQYLLREIERLELELKKR